MLIFELDRAPIAKGLVEPAFIVGLIDKVWKTGNSVGERLVAPKGHSFSVNVHS